MNINVFKKKETKLDKEIDNILDWMASMKPGTDEYAKLANQLEKLYKIKCEGKKDGIKPDTIVVVAANLLGILLILTYEEENIITSKALGFILKGRV